MATATAKAAVTAAASARSPSLSRPFPVGSQERFLPNFAISLLRTTHLGPHHARFQVPLWFNKLDLRDYLYHVYNVRIHSVRSYVSQQPVQQDKPGVIKPHARRWFRPRAKKFMTVELARPFVWPDEPEDFSPWNKEEMEMAVKAQKENQQKASPTSDAQPNTSRREHLREQAKALLEGKVKWEPSRVTTR